MQNGLNTHQLFLGQIMHRDKNLIILRTQVEEGQQTCRKSTTYTIKNHRKKKGGNSMQLYTRKALQKLLRHHQNAE